MRESKPTWGTIQIAWIAKQVSELMSISVEDLQGPDRTRDINTARKFAMALCYRYTSHSYSAIGKFFNRNHATVLHAERGVEREIKNRGELLGIVWSQLLGRIEGKMDNLVGIVTDDTLPLLAAMVRKDLPTPTMAVVESIVRYVEQRAKPSQFVMAVLANDLEEAVGRADARNARGLSWLVAFIYNNVPGNLWRNREAIADHLKSTDERPVFMDWSTGCTPLAEHFKELFSGESDAN